MNERTPVQVFLDDEDRARLESLAERLGVSMAETIRVALRRLEADGWGGGEDDPLLRLAGSLDSAELPCDLSTRHDDYAVSGYPAPRIAEPEPDRPASDE